MKKKYSDSYPMVSQNIGSNGYRILASAKIKPLIAKTVITQYPNGLGEMEWLDSEDRIIAFHYGTLDDDYPRLGEVVISQLSKEGKK